MPTLQVAGKKQIVVYFCQIQLFIFFKKKIIYYLTQTDDINVFCFISNVPKYVSGIELAALDCNINSGYFIMYVST